MERPWFRMSALVEWVAAAVAVVVVVWVISVPIQRALGPGVQAAVAELDGGQDTPPGVPTGATLVPVMLLLDGRQLRQGDLHTRLDMILPLKFADGAAVVSAAHYGDRHTRRYEVNGTRFYVVCERAEPNGPLRVAGIYLP